jgi:sterol desaturase/sphingolipid hydroxylase (fatty acid hydroxylase superfamily)
LRTNFIHLFYRFLFWSPLCLLGFPPQMILFIESITASQNFIVHTEKIKKLGILDWIFNTPSNHRVHHGSNPEYIDKNLGGIFMFYDHLFGTYAKETVPPVYGITHNIHTHNPVKIILHEFFEVSKGILKNKGWKAKLQYLFSPPE